MKISECLILVIDDDDDILIQSNKILSNIGAKVLGVSNIEAAFTVLASNSPHLIISDIKIGNETGFDFLKKIKEDSRYNTIPVVMLSALSDKDSVFKCISLGAADYIIKPLSTVQIIKKVRKTIKDQDFLKYDFSREELPDVVMGINSFVHAAGEVSLKVVSLSCFHQSLSPLRISSKQYEDFSKVLFKTHTKGQPLMEGMYANEFIAVPGGPEFIKLKKGLLK